ncbi:acyl-CoA dehydrogenase family protein [Dactylosporangium fulvum]|uniref:Dibenzothiophene monooxygenase n=1 Tax=Dactylosporangium fulvum TaxID=53359 RepID=A0ABY5VQG4_9ACTN|nr:acyl-CoA dehydrogenase family protein [Dactylosporangium fulvum]UWP80017.1 acyl-CoA dehydrogenase family protein [Dactylosporangium fulvum]
MTRSDESYERLADRFRPTFAKIAEGAVTRELDRELAHEAVGLLRDAKFGAVRVPAEYGGFGASITDLFRLLIELGEADSNLPQILRAHFGITEERLHDPDAARRERWLRRIGEGAVIGNAVTETGDGALGTVATAITDDDGDWRITGAKHYSTGSLYADWIAVLARRGEEDQGFAMVRADDPGLSRVDDWDGFGQRLTASGTTLLTGAATLPEDVFWYADRGPNYMIAFYQLVHLATLSGIARAIVRDAAAYVRGRRRVFSHGSGATPASDPLVQQVVGRLSGLAFAAEATTLAAVGRLEHINRLRADGEVPQAAYDDAEIATSRAYITVADTVLRAANLLFETGGASLVRRSEALDRHWRNARTLAVHNPVIYKERAVGDHVLNDAAPGYSWIVGVKK